MNGNAEWIYSQTDFSLCTWPLFSIFILYLGNGPHSSSLRNGNLLIGIWSVLFIHVLKSDESARETGRTNLNARPKHLTGCSLTEVVDPRFWPLDRDDLEKSIHGCQRFRSENYRSRFRLMWLWAVFRFWWDLKRALPNRSLFLVFAFENQFYRYSDLIWITSGGEHPVYRISNMFTSFIWLLWSLSIASCLKHLNKHHFLVSDIIWDDELSFWQVSMWSRVMPFEISWII